MVQDLWVIVLDKILPSVDQYLISFQWCRISSMTQLFFEFCWFLVQAQVTLLQVVRGTQNDPRRFIGFIKPKLLRGRMFLVDGSRLRIYFRAKWRISTKSLGHVIKFSGAKDVWKLCLQAPMQSLENECVQMHCDQFFVRTRLYRFTRFYVQCWDTNMASHAAMQMLPRPRLDPATGGGWVAPTYA